MKKYILIACMAAFAACQQGSDDSASAAPAEGGTIQAQEGPRSMTTIQWLDSSKQIGKIPEGEKVEIAYRFVNSGNAPLVIENVVVSCGCTVAEKPAEPIAPGKEGVIKAVFDSHGRAGTQHKSLTVYANTEIPMHPLAFDVEVVAKQ